MGKQPTFPNAITGVPTNRSDVWGRKKFHTYDALLPRSKQCFWFLEIWFIQSRGTTQIWVVTRHQYGISALVPRASFGGKPVVTSPNVGCFIRLIGSFSIDDGNGSKNVSFKMNSRFFNLWRVYSSLLQMASVGEFPWSWFLEDRTQV